MPNFRLKISSIRFVNHILQNLNKEGGEFKIAPPYPIQIFTYTARMLRIYEHFVYNAK